MSATVARHWALSGRISATLGAVGLIPILFVLLVVGMVAAEPRFTACPISSTSCATQRFWR